MPGPAGGPVATQAAFASHQMMARLAWHPEGLRLPAEAEVPDDLSSRFSLHGQTTFLNQGSRLPLALSRREHLVPRQAQATTTATIFLGLKLLEGPNSTTTRIQPGFRSVADPRIAGFVNGEAQKAGAPFPKLRSNRYFVRQTFGLGGETVTVPDGPNQVAATYDVERITVVAGKFALGDFFDGNVYAHDPRVDFMNWSLWASSAGTSPPTCPGSRKA